MKVASFNVNSIRARLPIVLKWLQESGVDVLCAQETKVQDKDFPGEAFKRIGYKYAFAGQKSYNGVAIISKLELEDVKVGLDDEPRDEARLIRAKVGGVTIVNTYVPQGYMVESDKYAYKLEWFRRLKRYFEKNFKASERLLWVGDLNVAREARDVYDPDRLWGHVCFNEDVQNGLKDVCGWGFTDLFRNYCDEAGQYTFWDYRMRGSFSRNLGWKLDHIMATKAMAEKSKACYIDKEPRGWDKPSDHTPIVAEFEL